MSMEKSDGPFLMPWRGRTVTSTFLKASSIEVTDHPACIDVIGFLAPPHVIGTELESRR